MTHFAFLLMIITAIQCGRFPVFVRVPFGDTLIPIEIASEDSVQCIKDALETIPEFECRHNYVIMLNDKALDDDAILSDSGITTESVLDSKFIDPDVHSLRIKGFNESEIVYFMDILQPHGLNVYAAFWALGDCGAVSMHFVKRRKFFKVF